MDGVLVIDKPEGPTSHDVVAIARRGLRERRIGHTGTLDPFASGVLPLVVGRATRLAQYLTHGPKAYLAVLQLGLATTTYDRTGTPLPRERWVASPAVTPAPPCGPQTIPTAAIAGVLDASRGTFLQRPPAFSAKKVGGRKAYDLARRDGTVDLQPVPVSLDACRIVSREGDAVVLELQCSAGFYVRSLAHDVGVALGCGAHLAALRRTRSASFTLEDAIPLGALTGTEAAATAAAAFVPLLRLLPWLPSAQLTAEGTRRVQHGQPARTMDVGAERPGEAAWPLGEGARLPAPDQEGLVRLFAPDGTLLGLARRVGSDGLLHPFLNLV